MCHYIQNNNSTKNKTYLWRARIQCWTDYIQGKQLLGSIINKFNLKLHGKDVVKIKGTKIWTECF